MVRTGGPRGHEELKAEELAGQGGERSWGAGLKDIPEASVLQQEALRTHR